jgi:hypothetical protein
LFHRLEPRAGNPRFRGQREDLAMEHIAALLLIIGCSDDLSQCRELPAPAAIFETKEDCDQQLPSSLGAFTGQFEQLYAQCVPVDPAMEEENAELVWEVHADGTLTASIEVLDAMVASNSPSTESAASLQNK